MNFTLRHNPFTQCLELIDADNPKQKPFTIDFNVGKMAYRFNQGIGRKQDLARAVGIKKEFIPTVLDATAGLGRDAFILACCGCSVTLCERSIILYQLLADAISRAKQDAALQESMARMQLIQQDSLVYLQQLTAEQIPDVIYVDPMYPERKKSALVKQDMRIVRQVVGDDVDTVALLQQALQVAKKRVVVKRPKLAEVLLTPHHQIHGKTTRYDIYLT